MTNQKNNLKNQALFYATSFLLISFLAGCSDSKENSADQQANSNPQEILEGSKIEVIQNSNAHEVKVEEKNEKRAKNDSFYYDYGEKSAYDQKAQPANKDASVRVRPRSTVEANMNIRSPYEELQISMIVNNLSKNFIVKCSACHNDYANGLLGPSLIGRDSDYIYGKIKEFKSGKKVNVLMKDLIHMMSDKEIREIADEIYTFNQEIKKVRSE